ncbi:MAG TPA: hypothetical protein DCO77_00585 [Nitrospiraceae bacterium]|nr:hypothetical protein [Nitrospiraceae bacterium]
MVLLILKLFFWVWCGALTQLKWRDIAFSFFAHPLRVLHEILDPSKATFPLERDLKQCAFALRDASLGQGGCPKNFLGPYPGTCGLG